MDKNTLSLERMREDIAKILHEDPAEIHDDDNLIDMGLDSIRAMMVFTRWQQINVHLDFADMARQPYLGYWWQILNKKQD